MGVIQKDLAMTSGTGLRFIIDLEQGKPTCQLGKVLTVLHTLAVKIEVIPPGGSGLKRNLEYVADVKRLFAAGFGRPAHSG